MWDRHLLELLHLPRDKEHAEGQRSASSSSSAPERLEQPSLPVTWLPGWQAALLGSLNTQSTGPGVRAQELRPLPGLGIRQGCVSS